ESIDAGAHRYFRMTYAHNVVKDDTAVAMDTLDHVVWNAQRRQDHRNAMLDADREVIGESRVRGMDDQVDAEGSVIGAKRQLDVRQPLFEAAAGAMVQRGQRTHYAAATGFDHEVGPRYQEHRRGDRRNREASLQQSGQWQLDSQMKIND